MQELISVQERLVTELQSKALRHSASPETCADYVRALAQAIDKLSTLKGLANWQASNEGDK